jgi:serine/threonine protein kinase
MESEERHDRIRRERPEHYCPHCTAIVFADEGRCPECDRSQPPAGWPALRNGFDPCLGRVLGERYLVSKFVGCGSSGNVYRAESLSTFRRFAVKIVQLQTDAKSRAVDRLRFEREIDALSRLRNPHITQVYEVIMLRNGFIALVMDFLDGVTLEQLVSQEGAISVPQMVSIAHQVANGLHEAHEAGMIHRDLKPENIMIDWLLDGEPFASILDFGIVQIADDSAKLTQGYLGTPLYSSPEQAQGRIVDRRSDIYSLGAVFFFTLTGRPPFLGDTAYEVLLQHARSTPPTLRKAGGKSYPEKLETLIARMLAKDPDDRPADLSKVLTELVELRSLPPSEGPSVLDSAKLLVFPPNDTGDSGKVIGPDSDLIRTQTGRFIAIHRTPVRQVERSDVGRAKPHSLAAREGPNPFPEDDRPLESPGVPASAILKRPPHLTKSGRHRVPFRRRVSSRRVPQTDANSTNNDSEGE